MDIDLSQKEKVVGLKQTIRAVESKNAKLVYIANDVNPNLIKHLVDITDEYKIPVSYEYSLLELGKLANIKVQTTAIALLN